MLVGASAAVKREGIGEQMNAAQEADVPERPTGGLLPVVGAVLAYAGFAAIAVSAGWTTAVHPFSEPGVYQRHLFGLLALALVGVAIIGRGALAATAAGKLLCALGAAVCVSVAVDPTLESIGAGLALVCSNVVTAVLFAYVTRETKLWTWKNNIYQAAAGSAGVVLWAAAVAALS